jgi:hypothetical protein
MPIFEAASTSRTIFFGPFVHCAGLGELDICESGAIGVDEDGVIAFIDRDVKFEDLDAVVRKHGWVDCKVVRIYDSGFFFPGFIGMCVSTIDSTKHFGLHFARIRKLRSHWNTESTGKSSTSSHSSSMKWSDP